MMAGNWHIIGTALPMTREWKYDIIVSSNNGLG
jgi:hypothetical protein